MRVARVLRALRVALRRHWRARCALLRCCVVGVVGVGVVGINYVVGIIVDLLMLLLLGLVLIAILFLYGFLVVENCFNWWYFCIFL